MKAVTLIKSGSDDKKDSKGCDPVISQLLRGLEDVKAGRIRRVA